MHAGCGKDGKQVVQGRSNVAKHTELSIVFSMVAGKHRDQVLVHATITARTHILRSVVSYSVNGRSGGYISKPDC